MKKVRDFLIGLKEGFGDFGAQVANVVNFILLSFVYIFGVGTTSIVAKLKGKHFLELEIDKGAVSYFERETIKGKEKDEYYRQF